MCIRIWAELLLDVTGEGVYLVLFVGYQGTQSLQFDCTTGLLLAFSDYLKVVVYFNLIKTLPCLGLVKSDKPTNLLAKISLLESEEIERNGKL